MAYESRDRTVIVAIFVIVVIAALIFLVFWALGDDDTTPTRTETVQPAPEIEIEPDEPSVPPVNGGPLNGGGDIITVPVAP